MPTVPPPRESLPLRHTLHRSRLVRQLSAWTGVDAAAAGQDTAQRLSAWVGVAEAIALHAAHQSVRAAAPASARPVTSAAALEQELQRTRDALAAAILAPHATGPVPRRGLPRPRAVRPVQDTPPADFAPYRLRHLDVQRQMELRIDALRHHARQVLAAASPRLAQLATLDAAIEPLLAGREQRLLAGLPALLEKHFQQLRKSARAASDAPAAPSPANAGAADPASAWLYGFAREFQEALLGELEVRLQPVTGLVEALRNEHVPTLP